MNPFIKQHMPGISSMISYFAKAIAYIKCRLWRKQLKDCVKKEAVVARIHYVPAKIFLQGERTVVPEREFSLMLQSPVAISQLDKAVRAVTKIGDKEDHEIHRDNTDYGISPFHRTRVNVHTGELPVPAGMLMLVGICTQGSKSLSKEQTSW